jgi:hypothetical protein
VRLKDDVLFIDVFPLSDLGDPSDGFEAWDINIATMHYPDHRISDSSQFSCGALLFYLPQLRAVQ